MAHIKARLFAIFLIAISAGLVYINWQELMSSGTYSKKIAAFAPVGVVGGLFLTAFPTKGGKPDTTADKLLVLGVFVIGLVVGLVNWYLMDPGFFGG